MDKMKLLFIALLLLVPFVAGEVECSKVLVAKFNYDDGRLTYRDKVVKCGYAPDYILQPEDGLKAELVSTDGKVISSFRFRIPLDYYFDLSDPLLKTMSGGIQRLNQTDFALIFPYKDDARAIVLYNSRNFVLLDVPLVEERFIQKKSSWWLLLIVLLVIISLIIYSHHKKSLHRKTYK